MAKEVKNIAGVELDLNFGRIANDNWHTQNLFSTGGGVTTHDYWFTPQIYIRVRRLLYQAYWKNPFTSAVQIPLMLSLTINPAPFVSVLDAFGASAGVVFGNTFYTLYFSPTSPGINQDLIFSPGVFYSVQLTTVDTAPVGSFLGFSHNFEWQPLGIG